MLEWLIIGGGVHGTYLSRVLTHQAGVASSGVRVLDPWEEPLSRFLSCASATGMGHLRSSIVHHLDAEPMSLRRFAIEGEAERIPMGSRQRVPRPLLPDRVSP